MPKDLEGANTTLRRCRRPTCRRLFLIKEAADAPHVAKLLYCPECRALILGEERNNALPNLSAAEVEGLTTRHGYDYRIVDENGTECWALDLAERYRRETQPRPV